MHGTFKEEIYGLDDPTTQDDTFRIIDVHNRAKAIAQVVCRLGDDFDDQFISVLNGVGKQP